MTFSHDIKKTHHCYVFGDVYENPGHMNSHIHSLYRTKSMCIKLCVRIKLNQFSRRQRPRHLWSATGSGCRS